jgi:hypothetical protein
MRYIRTHVVVVIGAAAALCILIFSAQAATLLPFAMQSDEGIARTEVAQCSVYTTEAEKETCYQKNVPTLMDKGLSMERAFEVVQLIQSMDTGYQSCHVLAHLLASKEVAKDPSKWKDVVVRSPMSICGSGAVHGAFQERFRIESAADLPIAQIKDMLLGVCDPRGSWNPTFLDRSSCMHGMGHLFLYVTNADVPKSVALCKVVARLEDFDFRQTCYEGVFMQLYQPIEPEDELLIRDVVEASNDTETYCAQFTGLVFNTCVKESWPAVQGSSENPEVFEDLCKRTTDRDAELYCASALVYPMIETLQYDVPKIEKFCSEISDLEIKNICWGRTATKFIWANRKWSAKAVGICRDAPEASKDVCWNHLTSYATQGLYPDSPETRALCSAMPEPYKAACAKQTKTTL